MRIQNYLMVLAACLALTGCQTGNTSGDESASRNQAHGADRQSFLSGVQEQMTALDDKISALGERSRGLREDARVQADQTLAALRKQREELGRKFDELKDSSRGAWESAKSGFSSAWDQMQSSMANASSKFN